MNNTLIDRIEFAMRDDYEDSTREKRSRCLIDCYNLASDGARNAIDACFTALCGQSLESLIEEKISSLSTLSRLQHSRL